MGKCEFTGIQCSHTETLNRQEENIKQTQETVKNTNVPLLCECVLLLDIVCTTILLVRSFPPPLKHKNTLFKQPTAAEERGKK